VIVPRCYRSILLTLFLGLSVLPSAAQLSVQSISVVGKGDTPEIEIRTSGKITPETQAVTGPDRIVLDFPNSIPASTLHALRVNQGVLKSVRFGQYQANPPVTRVVLDLTEARAFQVFPSGNGVVIKLGTTSAASPAVVPPATAPKLAAATPVVAPATARPASLHPAPSPAGQLAVQSISLVGKGDAPEVEVRTSGKVAPETMAVTGPNRIVLDFPNSVPARTLRDLHVNTGVLKGVRFRQYHANPPVTRVVLDLTEARAFQVFPSGNAVLIKLGGAQAPLAAASAVGVRPVAPVVVATPAPPPTSLHVEVKGNLLRINSDKATLSEILYEVQRQTGADIPIPAGAEQEQVVANLGPAPGPQVLAALLNGSRFNYVFVGTDSDRGGLSQVLLTAKEGAAASPAPEPRTVAYTPGSPPPSTDVNDTLPEAPAEPVEPDATSSNPPPPPANPPQ
jgi:hypothetical protein